MWLALVSERNIKLTGCSVLYVKGSSRPHAAASVTVISVREKHSWLAKYSVAAELVVPLLC